MGRLVMFGSLIIMLSLLSISWGMSDEDSRVSNGSGRERRSPGRGDSRYRGSQGVNPNRGRKRIRISEDIRQANSQDTRLASSQDTRQANSQDTRQANSQDTRLANSQDTRQANSQDTRLANGPDIRLPSIPDTSLTTSPDSRRPSSSDTRLRTSSDTRLRTSSDTRQPNRQDTRLRTSSDTRQPNSQDTRLRTRPDTRLRTIPDTRQSSSQAETTRSPLTRSRNRSRSRPRGESSSNSEGVLDRGQQGVLDRGQQGRGEEKTTFNRALQGRSQFRTGVQALLGRAQEKTTFNIGQQGREQERRVSERPSSRLTTRPPRSRYRSQQEDQEGSREREGFNRFSGYNKETQQLRNRLFLETKAKYCRENSRENSVPDYDYSDYYLQGSLSTPEVPLVITVTHLQDQTSSLQVVPVDLLQSTEISGLPVIYAQSLVLDVTPGLRRVVYQGLTATETEGLRVKSTCVNNRQTELSDWVTSTLYTVQSVTQDLPIPTLPSPNDELNQLLQLLLTSLTSPLPLSFPTSTQPQAVVRPTQVTSYLTHSSTYLTILTKESTTLLSLTFRGQPVVTTIVETDTTQITATEFSTETLVATSLVTEFPTPPLVTAPPPNLDTVTPTQNLVMPTQDLLTPNLDLVMSTQDLVIPTQDLVTPSLGKVTPTGPTPETYLVTHTETSLATLTTDLPTVIPLTFRGRALETTVYNKGTKVVTESNLVIETRTRSQVVESMVQEQNQGLDRDQDLDLDSLERELVSLLLEGEPDLVSSNLIVPSERELVSLLLEGEPDLVSSNLIVPSPSTRQELPRSTITTIFRSGRLPGQYTTILSTVFLREPEMEDEGGREEGELGETFLQSSRNF